MIALDSPMSGDGVRAELLSESHHAALKAACAEDSDIWQIYSLDFGPAGFDRNIARIAELGWKTFALFEADELVGMSSFLNIDPPRGVLEIGGTYYRPSFRGTGINRRIKDMMIGRAIDAGYRRIEFRVDARNQRSQAAMAKLDAVREGVMRADRLTWTGHLRDTVLFSILRDEWR
jgi:RimJ/RimL family protein N-acetyltransferase